MTARLDLSRYFITSLFSHLKGFGRGWSVQAALAVLAAVADGF